MSTFSVERWKSKTFFNLKNGLVPIITADKSEFIVNFKIIFW